jgi:hypothetical protein
VVPIGENEKRIKWGAIRAEYLEGASIRSLAAKYGLNKSTICKRSKSEGWVAGRTEIANRARTITVQKTAEAEADNATIAADLKKRLLLRLQRIEQHFPEDATEVRKSHGKDVTVYRIKDLTAAYKDLTEDIASTGTDKNAPIYELLRKLDGECDV